MTSVAEAVRRVVDSDPCLRECLAKGIINYSELARRLLPAIERLTGSRPSFESVKMAAIRYAEKLASSMEGIEGSIVSLLSMSALEVRTGISVLTVRIGALRKLAGLVGELLGSARFFAMMQSLTSVTVIVDDEHLPMVRSVLSDDDIIDLYRDQAALVIVSPKHIVSTPGFIAYVSSLLARNGINITQIESCHTDTVLIISKKDLLQAFELLTSAIEMARLYASVYASSGHRGAGEGTSQHD
ncbi:MAG: ACT domain-containing protein [Crenarchaeota archaeon]|nr:ACT domain-containing protein [Thermoproteota archaeon]